ncbi:MAG: hypothetical protein P8N56_03770, partial [Schleiferiaceae bacterium]|nr:hypothetical protein [Schleiferiaceae bacterium]
MMRKTYMFFVLSLLSLTAFGQNVILEENFNYTAGAQLQSNGWYGHSAASTNPISVDSSTSGLSLSQTGYLGNGIGPSALVFNTGADENKPFASSIDTNSVYTYFLLKVTDPVSTSGYFFHYVQYNSPTSPTYTSVSTAYRARTFVIPGSNPSSQYKLALTFNASSNGGADTTANLNIGETYLVVVKYSFVSGASNDEVSLFLFEDGDNISSEPSTPTIGPLTGTAADLSIAQGVALRQFSSAQRIVVDGLYSADGWLAQPPCPASQQCAYTVNMTDAYGDGWNGNTVSFIQNGYTVGTVGGGFTTGSSY